MLPELLALRTHFPTGSEGFKHENYLWMSTSYLWYNLIPATRTGTVFLEFNNEQEVGFGIIRRLDSGLKQLQQPSKGYDQNRYHMWQFSGHINNLAFNPSHPNYGGGTTFNCESHQQRRLTGWENPQTRQISHRVPRPSAASRSECHRLSQEKGILFSLCPTPQESQCAACIREKPSAGLINLWHHKNKK